MSELVLVFTVLCLSLTGVWLIRLVTALVKTFVFGDNSRPEDNVSLFLGGFVLVTWSVSASILIYLHRDNPSVMGTLGDTMGLLNSLFSALAFAGVLYSIRQQNKVIKDQRQDFNEQMSTQYLDRFESTFFRLLEIHEGRKNKIFITYPGTVSSYTVAGDGAIIDHYINFRQSMLVDPDWGPIQDALADFLETNLTFFSFLDNLYAMHFFVLEHRHLDYKQKDFYLKIITRSASYEELAFYFYYYAFQNGAPYNVNTPDIFSQLPSHYLIAPSHRSFYYFETGSTASS